MLVTWPQGGGLNSGLSFWLPLYDSGSGAVNTAVASCAGDGTPTFTRTTTAWAKLSTGLWASVASGTARSHYLGADTTVGAYGGYLAEEARTNQCLQARDLSNASWTKTSTTAAKDQIGIDGAANSASSLTATANGGTCLQTITQAATLAALSFFIKRITGTGTITLQQGATTLDVTASINAVTYTRVELDATVLNPAIGIVMGTSGDKIAVDMGQFENGGFATSPIPTTTASVTRNADVLTYPSTGNISESAGTAYAEFQVPTLIASNTIIGVSGGAGAPLLGNTTTSGVSSYDGSTQIFGPVGTPTAGVIIKVTAVWGSSAFKVFANGVAGPSHAYDGAFGLSNIGVGVGNNGALNGTIRNIRIWINALADSQIVAP